MLRTPSHPLDECPKFNPNEAFPIHTLMIFDVDSDYVHPHVLSPSAEGVDPPHFRQNRQILTKIMISKIKCFDVPWSCTVFLESLDVYRMLPGSPGHEPRNLHFV